MSLAFPSNNDEWDFHNRISDLEHDSMFHDCPETYFCEDDPHCSYARCEGCSAPNIHCHCDADYMRFRDK